MRASVPISWGRTFCWSSRRKTGTFAASIGSSTWSLPPVFEALPDTLRMRWASSQINASRPSFGARVKSLKYVKKAAPSAVGRRGGGVREQLPAPLLELHDHVGVAVGVPVDPGEHDVGAFARQRKPVFDQHLDLAQPRVDQVPREDGKAALPRPPLGGGDRDAVPQPQLLGESGGEVALGG